MPLSDFQAALGAKIRGGGTAATDDAGLRFTMHVQRSWCRGRAAKGARLTLSILDVDVRQRLLDTWVAAGGGTASVLTAEADAFLDFIASHLPAPSHALTICRLEQATLRASEGTATFSPRAAAAVSAVAAQSSRRDGRSVRVEIGRYAALVDFHADPDRLLAELAAIGSVSTALPPVTAEPVVSILFAPGLDDLSRVATADEIALWNRLRTQAPLPSPVNALLDEGHALETIDALAAVGAIEMSLATAALRA